MKIYMHQIYCHIISKCQILEENIATNRAYWLNKPYYSHAGVHAVIRKTEEDLY